MPVHVHAIGQPAFLDLTLERLTVVALARQLQHRLGHGFESVEYVLDPLVALEPAEIQQRGHGRPFAGLERLELDAHVIDVDLVAADADLPHVARARFGNRHESRDCHQ